MRNCSLFFASACGRQLREGAGEDPALLLRPARGLAFGRAQQLELGDGDCPGRLGHRCCLGRGLQLGCQLPRPRLRISEPALGETGRAGRTVQASHVPGDADGETGREADDHSEDHVANVTMGCVNTGDRLAFPALGAVSSPHVGGRHPGTEPIA